MDVVLQVVTAVATTICYVSKKTVSDKKDLKNPLSKTMKCEKNIEKSLQEESIDISFENISFSLSLGFMKGQKEILHKINGNFPSGQLIVIIGPSGAGKTTLLDILSGYRNSGVQGTVQVNGIARNLETFKNASCYITHDNHLQQLLTIWESMKFAADLKLGHSISQEEKDIRIKEILSALFLDKCASTRTAYLSGGQQKRLSIALELIDDPLVMFLDEPTTGLDSSSCYHCIRLLQKLARQGKTIICTIHQPSAALFQLFDQVYVLAEGNCVYQGATKNIVSFLESINLPCPVYHNPADYVIELACQQYGKNKIATMVEAISNGKNSRWLEEHKCPSRLQIVRGRDVFSFLNCCRSVC